MMEANRLEGRRHLNVFAGFIILAVVGFLFWAINCGYMLSCLCVLLAIHHLAQYVHLLPCEGAGRMTRFAKGILGASTHDD